ncbi:TA0956 family protein [Ferroplasma sp.]|uniref:TA0956 family protein n=1 Tax=Ferroplasma sp. TaxID=2591003 RepID=UPI00307E12FC
MVKCVMYNLKMSETHPSTICVLADRFEDSFRDLIEVLTSPLPVESLEEYIEEYARTDEIMPEDKTIGFVIINKEKKVASLNFNEKTYDDEEIQKILQKYKELGFKTEIELD